MKTLKYRQETLHPIATNAALAGLTFVIFGMLVPCPVVHADEIAAEAAAILDRYIEVTGGAAAYERIHNRISKDRIVHVGMDFENSVVSYSARPNRRYMAIESDALGSTKRGTDGDIVWSLSEQAGPQIETGEARAAYLDSVAFDRVTNWRSYYRAAELVGEESVDGRLCHKVAMTPNNGKVEVAYFDKETDLLTRFEKSHLSSNMPAVELDVLVSDYKEVDGILLPHKMHQSFEMCGSKREMIIITDHMEHNVDLPSDRFNPPAEILALARKSAPVNGVLSALRSLLTGSISKPCCAKCSNAETGSTSATTAAPCGRSERPESSRISKGDGPKRAPCGSGSSK